MKFNNELNYVVLANNVNNKFLEKFINIPIISNNLNFEELKKRLEFFPSKQVVFYETWYNLRKNELKEILALLKLQNISFIYVTSNTEYTLLGDYIYVYDEDKIIIEGKKETVLKEERLLKKLGYGLPFVVDLSTQLIYYDILDKVYFDMDYLVGDLWN